MLYIDSSIDVLTNIVVTDVKLRTHFDKSTEMPIYSIASEAAYRGKWLYHFLRGRGQLDKASYVD